MRQVCNDEMLRMRTGREKYNPRKVIVAQCKYHLGHILGVLLQPRLSESRLEDAQTDLQEVALQDRILQGAGQLHGCQ